MLIYFQAHQYFYTHTEDSMIDDTNHQSIDSLPHISKIAIAKNTNERRKIHIKDYIPVYIYLYISEV